MFLLIFIIILTVNGFFFFDSTMHKIYINAGNLDFLYRLPQIIYSLLITSILKSLIKKLGSSEHDILNIKKDVNNKKSKKEITEKIYYLKIKFTIFFIICYLLILFFWYYISCFCAI